MDFVIDGNAYINVAISVARSIAFKDKSIGSNYYVNDIFNEGEFILKEQIKIQFRNFCLNYFHSLIAPVGSKISRVHLAFDSKSWRKDFIHESFIDDTFGNTESSPDQFEYKENRKRDNMTYLFFDYFQKEIAPVLIEKCGINYYRINGTEGDDILAYLCEVIDGDVLIYTVDSDISQLTYNHDKNVIVIYPKQQRKHKKLCVPQNFVNEIHNNNYDDFFSLDSNTISESQVDQIISTLKSKEYVEYIIDPVEDLFTKIFRGDKKDSIPRMDKITPLKNTKLIELIQNNYGIRSLDLLDNFDETFINFVVKNICEINKIKETDIDHINDTREHFIFNTRIIRLSSKMFPEDVLNDLQSSIQPVNFTKFNFKEYTNIKNNPSLI